MAPQGEALTLGVVYEFEQRGSPSDPGPEREDAEPFDGPRALLLCRPAGREAVAAAPVGRSLGAAVNERPGPAADFTACS